MVDSLWLLTECENTTGACGIKVEGKNKWVTLIQNASTQNAL